MNVSGARVAADIDLEDFEKRLRTAGTPAGGVEDPLAELARLVEASRPRAAGGQAAPPLAAAAPPVAAPPPVVTPPQPPSPIAPPIEAAALRPAFDDPSNPEPEIDAAYDDSEPATAGPELYADIRDEPASSQPRRSRRWLWTVSTLAIAGVAMIGAVFALKGRLPGMPKAPPFIAAAQGPTKVQPPSDATVSTPNDAGASLLKDNTQVGRVTVVNNEEQPVDLHAQTAASSSPAPAAASDSSGASAVRNTVDTPVVVMTPPPPAAAVAPSFPEPKPVRTISLRPDGTPIPALPADTEPAQTASAPAAPPPPAKPATKATAAGAEPSTPKIDLPTKLSAKSSARVVVAKTDTTAPADAAGEPVQLGATSKSEKPAKVKTQVAAAEPEAPAAADQAATTSGGWAVQLAAPRSEAEAKSVVAKLNEKYASALGGAALGVHKATSRGEAVYRVRVSGLSKADAAALCARVKGDGGQCFVTK